MYLTMLARYSNPEPSAVKNLLTWPRMNRRLKLDRYTLRENSQIGGIDGHTHHRTR